MSEPRKSEPQLYDTSPHELRILNGLHRGAALPLDGSPVTLGAGDEADVVLADHGIAADHALLERSGESWVLSATGGTVYAPGEHGPRTVLEIGAGGFARLGDIWLMIAPADARWEAPPAMPEADFDARAAQAEAAAEEALMPQATPAIQEAGAVAGAAATVAPRRPPPRHLRRAVLLLSTLAMLGAATAYALTTHPVTPAQPLSHPDAAAPLARAAANPLGKTPAPAMATTTASEQSRAELAELFRKRLADAELLNRFDLHLDARAWSMQAQLDDEESARFERILNSFIKEHRITFPVSAKAVTAEAMLPFKIGQVISGANPSLVTADGTRLYVGDDYRGVRVVAIQGDRLTFFGKRKIDVLW